ncbi:uncharacterized protein OCT59_003178 [Rhizophagus irregularis]|uniref:BTB domain-containing protein n=2 Tax=Rhizophagus irregularis TaxID=588596 RepID=A0A015K9W0_RHIIW|nr:hypothetical protein GLOIN_2v1773401 [Rhizophagus irregularis DAOM 181602=DAOM 197198]EXX56251.1 hypothetical protein RirG_217580 [Rhizophagus irregularis DAOM 197198w]POG72598.1 hypothetical protein GLOIN_2v1773401 [Rhizophagus irregularis DAOM 181602=DAOM 197198]UZO11619.1 hypothetical protein OCT59_003178 [Rhizophagus irregularis]GBC37018.1 BTB/POZ protein [Rhizophagus irregularis DAOM 181602=DAOM 197198]|eukprot:XP_025179464.1 hypothetical protein GLOIN_2v1773401 [Rhizophagus irregularis DAOM 181602=DAOM 197198]
MSDDIVDIVDIIDLKPSLLRDLKNLYKNLEKDNNNDYNVIIKVDQKNFKAHSVILKLRSEYFHNLINNELAKKMVKFSKKLTLEVSDINSNVFASCLKYIYTGKFSLQEDDDVMFDLFIAADNLKLIDMVDYLQKFFIENKSYWIENNLIGVYQTTLNHESRKKLQTYCEGIIEKDPELIFISDLFHTLKKTILLNLIKRDDISLPEFEIWYYLVTWVHEQEPPIDRDLQKWDSSDTIKFKERIGDFVPYIRFFAITSEDYYICVRPYKDVLPEKLVEQLEEYYLTKKTSPPPDALPPREMKEKNPNWLKRRHSMGKQPPGLQRKNTLAKPPVVVQPRIRTVSKIINNQKIKRISRWIDGNESNELGDSNNNHD